MFVYLLRGQYHDAAVACVVCVDGCNAYRTCLARVAVLPRRNQVKVTDIVTSAGELDRLTAEIDVLKQLKHKNIMTFYQSWFDKRNYTINFITELFTSGTLRQCVAVMIPPMP